MNKSLTPSHKTILQLIVISCLVGFTGDTLLQIGSKLGGPTSWGLKSIFIAGGMMTIFYIIYLYFLQLPINYVYLAIYGIILDFIFRITMIFPSLSEYYNYFNYFWSAVWGAIPLVLPLFIYNVIENL